MLHQLKRTLGPLGHMQHKSYVMEKHTQTHIETRHQLKSTLGPLLGHMQHKSYVMEKHPQTQIETQHQRLGSPLKSRVGRAAPARRLSALRLPEPGQRTALALLPALKSQSRKSRKIRITALAPRIILS